MSMARVSLVMLTYNRAELVARTMSHNLACAGSPIDELIWVDNGSTDDVRDVMYAYKPDVCVLNKRNLGVAKGYNRGFALATSDYIVITDDDMLMPDKWLATFRAYLLAIPTGVACMFHEHPGLVFRRTHYAHGLAFHPCLPWGRRLVSRELLMKKIGYLREDFGLYGNEDIEWAHRAVRVCQREGLLTYAIAGQRPVHLGIPEYDPSEYVAFKKREGDDPRKKALLRKYAEENYPYYTPYGQAEAVRE